MAKIIELTKGARFYAVRGGGGNHYPQTNKLLDANNFWILGGSFGPFNTATYLNVTPGINPALRAGYGGATWPYWKINGSGLSIVIPWADQNNVGSLDDVGIIAPRNFTSISNAEYTTGVIGGGVTKCLNVSYIPDGNPGVTSFNTFMRVNYRTANGTGFLEYYFEWNQ